MPFIIHKITTRTSPFYALFVAKLTDSGFTLQDMSANPYKRVLYDRYLSSVPGSKFLPTSGESGAVCLLLTVLGECDDISTYIQGANPYKWILDRLQFLKRYEIVEHLRADWNRAANA
jgi:hypothetical protein